MTAYLYSSPLKGWTLSVKEAEVLRLRFPGLWLSLGWIMVLILCAAALVPSRGAPFPTGVDKILHGLTYLLLMAWFSGIYQRSRYAAVAGALLVLGVALEFGQRALEYRSFEVNDMLANGVGIALGWLLAVLFIGGWCQRLETLLPGSPSS